MSSYLSVRQELVTVLEAEWSAAFPSAPIYYENGIEVDPAQAPELYLELVIEFDDAELSNVGAGASTGYNFSGAAFIGISVPKSSGMNKTYDAADKLVDILKARSFTSFFIGAPVLLNSLERKGRHFTPLRVPVCSHIA